MSYEKKYQERTIEYRKEGHTLQETSRVFKVSISTIRDWTKLYQETGGYALLQCDATMDSTLFEMWFERILLPALPDKAVIVTDNATFHRKSRLIPLTERRGHALLFLPPYSPDLNPIEHFWSRLKRQLRKVLPKYSSFGSALFHCFQVR